MSPQIQTPSPASVPLVQRDLVTFISGFMLFAALAIGSAIDTRQAVLFLIGGALGVTLFHASFGFTGGWRRLVVERRGRGLRAQMLMVAAAAVVFIPLLASDFTPGGRQLIGAYAPVGVSVVVGAFLFGLGMQLGGGCGSGTLFTVGGGHRRMLITLLFFVVGALIGTAHLPWWLEQPTLPAINLSHSLGWSGALAVTLAGLGGIALLSAWVEKRRHGSLEAYVQPAGSALRRWVFGPWSLITAALILAALNVATLLIAGHPWSITYAFGLWGAKAAQATGIAVSDWTFWTWPAQARALNSSVLADITSVMNFGIMLGAALAAGLAGRFAQGDQSLRLAPIVAAVLGGLLMGYGARLSFGCNIGALFGGIASGSLHGWLWFALAFIGSLVGIFLRPLFGLNPRRKS